MAKFGDYKIDVLFAKWLHRGGEQVPRRFARGPLERAVESGILVFNESSYEYEDTKKGARIIKKLAQQEQKGDHDEQR